MCETQQVSPGKILSTRKKEPATSVQCQAARKGKDLEYCPCRSRGPQGASEDGVSSSRGAPTCCPWGRVESSPAHEHVRLANSFTRVKDGLHRPKGAVRVDVNWWWRAVVEAGGDLDVFDVHAAPETRIPDGRARYGIDIPANAGTPGPRQRPYLFWQCFPAATVLQWNLAQQGARHSSPSVGLQQRQGHREEGQGLSVSGGHDT